MQDFESPFRGKVAKTDLVTGLGLSLALCLFVCLFVCLFDCVFVCLFACIVVACGCVYVSAWVGFVCVCV